MEWENGDEINNEGTFEHVSLRNLFMALDNIECIKIFVRIKEI